MERLHRAGGPADLDFVNAGGLGQAKGQDQFVLRGITGTTGHFTALPGSPRPQTNPLTLIAVIRRCFISLQLLILHPSCLRVLKSGEIYVKEFDYILFVNYICIITAGYC